MIFVHPRRSWFFELHRRYPDELAWATLEPDFTSAGSSGPTGSVIATFDEPQRAVTPGQSAVFYDGDEVVGGGWII